MSPKTIIFESDATLIKQSGDNKGYIFNPDCIIYLGKPMQIMAGEAILIIPHQPNQQGPWKLRRTSFEEGQFIKGHHQETLAILIENCWLTQIIKLTNQCSLACILRRSGIQHKMIFVSDHELQKMTTFNDIITLEGSEDEDKLKCCDVKSFKKYVYKVKKCNCSH